MEVLAPDESGIARAVELLRAGEVIAYPTETVYGLGVDPENAVAVSKLFDIKGRSETQSVLLIAADSVQVAKIASNTSEEEQRLMDAFWPGPLSLVLFSESSLGPEFRNSDGKVCVRVPNDDVARAICREFGAAITSTSANRSGDAPATTVEAAAIPGVACVVDDGPRDAQAPSTVYDCALNIVYREGAIAVEALREIRQGDEIGDSDSK